MIRIGFGDYFCLTIKGPYGNTVSDSSDPYNNPKPSKL